MKAYYIPYGPKELATLFSVDFSEISKYYLEVKDSSLTTIATTNTAEVDQICCCGIFRIKFLNYLGAIDSINAKIYLHEHESKSDIIQKPTQYPLDKTVHSLNRFNVKAGDIYTLAIIDYNEPEMKWVNELIDSPFALMEWKGIQGQADSFIPIVVLDSAMVNRKIEDRYIYETIIKVKLSHERFIIRN